MNNFHGPSTTQGCPWVAETCTAAVKNGHLAILQWARSKGCPWGEWTWVQAAENGHLEVLEWARAHGCPLIGAGF